MVVSGDAVVEVVEEEVERDICGTDVLVTSLMDVPVVLSKIVS